MKDNVNMAIVGIGFLCGALFLGQGCSVLGPADADYCNVALVPELAEKIGVDLAERLQLAEKGRSLLDSLGGRHGPPVGPGDIADELGRDALNDDGKWVKEHLSEKQRAAFRKLFAQGKVVRVSYRTEKAKDKRDSGRFLLSFGLKNPGAKAPSLYDTRIRLRDAYKQIPSEAVALKLVDHESYDVNRAAVRWLNENSAAHKKLEPREYKKMLEAIAPGPDGKPLSYEERSKAMIDAMEARIQERKREYEQRMKKRTK